MAESTSSYISNGKAKVGGYIYACVKSKVKTIPTDATTPLAAEFVNLGCISKDGFTESMDTDTTDVKDATGETVASIDGGSKTTFSFTLISSSLVAALKQAFGEGNVTGSDGEAITVSHGGAGDWESYVYVYESVASGGRIDRQVIPDGRAIERGDVTKAPGDTVGYEMTIHARPDASGHTSYDYIAKAV